MNTPLENTRSLRVALVDAYPLSRASFELFMQKHGHPPLVLSVAKRSELLSALRGGLVVDVAFICFHGSDTSIELLKRLQQLHPDVRTIAFLDRADESLTEHINEAGAYTILSMEELTLVGLGELIEELARL